MQKILITGITGFVASYFMAYLNEIHGNVKVIGIGREKDFNGNSFNNIAFEYEQADLNNRLRVQDILANHRPDYVLHLASDSSVSYSWKYPIDGFQNNTNIFLNLIESIRILQLNCRILSVGSSEEYGIVDASQLPLNEEAPLNPISPYAVARVSQELLSKVYANGYDLDIVMTRSFNHIGAGQKDNFVISSFAKQVIQKKASVIGEIKTGDLSIIRDFLDVRDVVRAYYILLKEGKKGEIYNICSGKGNKLGTLLEIMCHKQGIEYTSQTSSHNLRPSDNPMIVGDNTKITSQTSWQPIYQLQESIVDILDYWQQKILP